MRNDFNINRLRLKWKNLIKIDPNTLFLLLKPSKIPFHLNLSILFGNRALCFIKPHLENHTFRWPPLSCSVSLSLVSTFLRTSRSNLRPKSLNIVDPPERTMLLYKPLLTSIGHLCTTSSTLSEIGCTYLASANSGWKKISGPRNRS